MTDEIDEILKFDPGANPKKESSDEIDEVLKFDPGIVEGTMQPKKSPFTGGTSPISTITGKPEMVYVPGIDPSAKPLAIFQSGYVDDIDAKIDIFSKSRGLSKDKYRVSKNNDIEFLNSEGKWQREIPDLPIFKMYSNTMQTVSNPAVIAGTIGAIAGPKGAIIGSMSGELLRKGIGAVFYNEKQTPIGNLANVGLEGLLATAGELGAGILKKGAQPLKTYFTKKLKGEASKILRYGGTEISEGVLSPEEHAKALMIQDIAGKFDINLAPHQLYDKEGMTNLWIYLRKHPSSSDAVRAFEDKLARSSDDAINDFIKSLGGFNKTPYQLGKETQNIAGKAIQKAEDVRRIGAEPLYTDVVQGSRQLGITVDTTSALESIDKLMNETVKGDPSYFALNRIKTMINQAEGDVGKLDRIKRSGIDTVLQKSKVPTLKREMGIVKEQLTNAMDDATGGAYNVARNKYQELSEPVNRLKDSVIGELIDIQKDAGIGKIPLKLFDIKNMPDAELLKEAKGVLQPKDPELWDELIGGYIRDVYEGLKVTESGKVINAAGKLNKQLFGTKKQQEIMKAALNPDDYNTFSDLMTVFQRASIGTQSQSMTAPLQAIGARMGEIPGSKIYRFAMFPRQAVAEWAFSKWNDILVSGRQKDLIKVLQSPEAIELIKTIKPLRPSTKKYIETFSVLTALVSNKLGIQDFWEGLKTSEEPNE